MRWGSGPPWERGVNGTARCEVLSCAKTSVLIEMPFGSWTCVCQRRHVLGGLHIGATWWIPLNRPCAAVMRPFCQITLTTWCPLHVAERDFSYALCDVVRYCDTQAFLLPANTVHGHHCSEATQPHTTWDLYLPHDAHGYCSFFITCHHSRAQYVGIVSVQRTLALY